MCEVNRLSLDPGSKNRQPSVNIQQYLIKHL